MKVLAITLLSLIYAGLILFWLKTSSDPLLIILFFIFLPPILYFFNFIVPPLLKSYLIKVIGKKKFAAVSSFIHILNIMGTVLLIFNLFKYLIQYLIKTFQH